MKIALLASAMFAFSLSVCAQSSSGKAPAQQSQTPPSATDTAAKAPPARAEDVKSIDSILLALYGVISGPAGERDWNRFRSLLVPEARLTSVVPRGDASAPSVHLLTVEDYVKGAGGYFAKNGFFESAIVNRVERFGNIAQVFSSYESRHAEADKPFTRGINSIQLFYDGSRWWILSIMWDEERGDNPLPNEFAAKAPVNQK